MDHIAGMSDAMKACGIEPRLPIIADGKMRRFALPNDPRGKKNGWYRLTIEGDIAFGAFGAWAGAGMSVNEKYFSKAKRDYQPADWERIKERQRQAEAEELAEQGKVAIKAREIWARRKLIDSHPYTDRKGVTLRSAGGLHDKIMVPMYHNDTNGKPQIVSVQFISADGMKRFLTGGRKIGCYGSISEQGASKEILYICEGYATGLSIYEATKNPVVIAFDAGNLGSVAQAIRKKYPHATITIAGDNDLWTKKHEGTPYNPGVEKATAAAEAHGCRVAIPCVPHDHADRPTDFNDIHVALGIDAVREMLHGK